MSFLSGLVKNAVTDVVTNAITNGSSGFFGQNGNFGDLHQNLIAVIQTCDADGNSEGNGGSAVNTIVDGIANEINVSGRLRVAAPMKDGSFSQSFNWNSPFEGMTPDQRNPMLSQAVTSQGFTQLEQILQVLGSGDSQTTTGAMGSVIANAAGSLASSTGISDFLQAAQGRSTITKLNSRQVYAGHEPFKISCTLVFRAYQDPIKEVELPLNKLLQMAYPRKLANSYVDSLKAYQAQNQAAGEQGQTAEMMAAVLFPSTTPSFVSLTYKGKNYAPLVIENITYSMVEPHSIAGDLFCEVQLDLASLTAVDAQFVKTLNSSNHSPIGKLAGEASSALAGLFNR